MLKLMKNSNKMTFAYIVSSLLLFGGLAFSGIYGVYVSVGLSFVRSSVPNVVENTGISNVSFNGTVDFAPSMSGIIILSIALVLLAVLDFISLIKQIVFFKQFKFIKNSKLENKMEQKVKSKGSVIFFAVVIDILSFILGVLGVVLNSKSYVAKNVSWIIYFANGAVAVLSVVSLVFLFKKLKLVKDNNKVCDPGFRSTKTEIEFNNIDKDYQDYLSNIENQLIKLKYLKSSKMISAEEYEILRNKIIGGENKNTK